MRLCDMLIEPLVSTPAHDGATQLTLPAYNGNMHYDDTENGT